MGTPLAYFDLIETFPKPGCAICRLLQQDAERLLDSLLYERVLEPETHQQVRAARGLCNEHAWQLISLRGGAVSIAVLYRAAVDETLKVIERTAPDAPLSSGFRGLRNSKKQVSAAPLADNLMPTAACMVCGLWAATEQEYISVFARYGGDERLQQAYRDSDGFCLPHFRLILRQPHAPEALRAIIDIQQAIWHRLRADLEKFIDQHQHERMHEAMGSESDSWQRAIGQLAGAQGVFGVQRRPGK